MRLLGRTGESPVCNAIQNPDMESGIMRVLGWYRNYISCKRAHFYIWNGTNFNALCNRHALYDSSRADGLRKPIKIGDTPKPELEQPEKACKICSGMVKTK